METCLLTLRWRFGFCITLINAVVLLGAGIGASTNGDLREVTHHNISARIWALTRVREVRDMVAQSCDPLKVDMLLGSPVGASV